MRSLLLSLIFLWSIIFLNLFLSHFPSLGKSTTEIREEKIKTEKIVSTQHQLVFWGGQINAKTPWRDGYLKLALLNWQLGNKMVTNYYLFLAKHEDPNNLETEKFTKLFAQVP